MSLLMETDTSADVTADADILLNPGLIASNYATSLQRIRRRSEIGRTTLREKLTRFCDVCWTVFWSTIIQQEYRNQQDALYEIRPRISVNCSNIFYTFDVPFTNYVTV